MSPVHVLVSEDPADEQAWGQAFSGAIDLYRFGRNAEAFERLTSAAAPIDLVVVTQKQGGPFNLSADQLIARVLESPMLSGSGPLAGLYVVVIGQDVQSTNPRVACVSSFDAAIRLIKFGELERAPRPTVAAPNARPDIEHELAMLGRSDLDLGPVSDGGSMFASSVISRIWDEGDQKAAREAAPAREPRGRRIEGGGGAASSRRQAVAAAPQAPASSPAAPAPQARPQVSSSMQLFTNEPPHPASLTAARIAAPVQHGQQPHPALAVQGHQVMGGGVAAPAVHGETVEVRSGIALQPARPYTLQGQAGYQGPSMRGGNVHGAGHGQPIPPALVQQVHSMVYPQQGPISDPLMTWSGSGGGNVMTQGVSIPQVGMRSPVPSAPIAAGHERPHARAGAMPQVAQPQAAPAPVLQQLAPPSDPLMRRVEGDGGVQFG